MENKNDEKEVVLQTELEVTDDENEPKRVIVVKTQLRSGCSPALMN